MAGVPAVDPWSAGFNALGAIAKDSPMGPTVSSTNPNSSMDNSGWTVNVGSGSATTTQTKSGTPTLETAAASLLSNPMHLLMLAAVVLVVVKYVKKK